ncbi:MAG: ABC transporter permease [Clostridiaceae bacterium]|jgi:ABC-2 type transport system permease protein|nr:ABC transporter permease [Clostridiaceae bacterium]
MIAYYKRELLSYFRSPTGWVAMALYAIISGFFFSSWIPSGGFDLSGEFVFVSGILFIVVPIITMRLFSEEKKTGTDVLMYTASSSLSGIVVAKYLAALTLFLLMNITLLIHMLILLIFGGEINAVTVGSLFGLLLLGAVFIAIGTFASATTENQIIAALLSFTVILLSRFVFIFSEQFRSITVGILSALNVFGISSERIASAGNGVRDAMNWLDPYAKVDDYFIGVFRIQPIIFCVSVIVFFLFLTYRLMEKRRWSQNG